MECTCLMTDSPAPVAAKQLKEACLELKVPKKDAPAQAA